MQRGQDFMFHRVYSAAYHHYTGSSSVQSLVNIAMVTYVCIILATSFINDVVRIV